MRTYLGSGHPGLAAPDGPGQDGARLVVAREDLGDAAVADSRVQSRGKCLMITTGNISADISR